MTSMQNTSQELRTKIETIVNDSYIKKCVGRATIPEQHLELLEILFSSVPMDKKESVQLGLASILLQMGLEMHSHVSVEEHLDPARFRSHQQMILAGDYYSSLFYYLLAQEEAFQVIEYFSNVVVTINQAKLSLHVQWTEKKPFNEEMLAYLKKITSGFLLAVADFFRIEDEFIFLWKKTATLSLLITDLERKDQWKSFPRSVRRQIHQEWQDLMDHIQRSPHEALINQVHSHEVFIKKIVAKES